MFAKQKHFTAHMLVLCKQMGCMTLSFLQNNLAREYKAAWLFPHFERMLVGTASRTSYMT